MPELDHVNFAYMTAVDLRPLEGMTFNMRFNNVEEVRYPNSTVGHTYRATSDKWPKNVSAP